MTIRAARLRHQVTLQSRTGSRDSFGELTTSWSNVATVWAAVEPTTATEKFIGGNEKMQTLHKVLVRYATEIAAIDNTWRVLFGSRALVIDSVINRDERNEYIELICYEGEKTE